MANMAEVSYKLVGDKKQVKTIYKTLRYMEKRKTPVEKNGWGKLWLGCLISKLGGDWEKYSCRGEILDFDYDKEVLTINMETAWTEQNGVRVFLQQTFPNIQIYYIEEEPGCDIFQTNDSDGFYFPERYFLDSMGDDSDYYETIEQVASAVSQIIGRKIESTEEAIEEALDQYNEDHEEDEDDCGYYFHVFEITES